jgi:hypothetical protein
VAHLSRHGLVHDYLGLGGYSLAELVDGFFWARALCRHARTSQKMMLWGLNGRPCTLARLNDFLCRFQQEQSNKMGCKLRGWETKKTKFGLI